MKKSLIVFVFILFIFVTNFFGNNNSNKPDFADLYSSFIENPTAENATVLKEHINYELQNQYYTAQTTNSKEMRSILQQISNCLSSDCNLQKISSLGIKFF